MNIEPNSFDTVISVLLIRKLELLEAYITC